MPLHRVVVTGLGAVTPIGNSAKETWQSMVSGRSGSDLITAFDASPFRTKFACEVKNFDCSSLFDAKTQRRLDRYAQFSVYVADEAFRDAGLDSAHVNKERMGVIWGSGMGGLLSCEEGCFSFAKGDGTPHFSPFSIPKTILSMGAGHISLHFGLKGPSFVVTTACASSSHAITQAFNEIRLGHADVILSGGADADITYTGIGGFNAMHALSTLNDTPKTASRPFSKSRDGFVLGEGAACLVLEDLAHAKARGAHIYAELVGEGKTSDAYHITAPDPEGTGAIKVMQLAMEDAGIKPEDIQYINTHGTSTPIGDIAEIKAIASVFGEHVYHLNLDSTKSMTGHMVGAAGAVEAMACVMAITDGIIPPTINHQADDEDELIDYKINFTFNQAQKRDVRYAMSNTFGFGGHNACLIFKKWEE